MTRAFNRLEWQFAGRYLRARRRESFISIIAIISFLGIMLGVATLIVVMAVMNGFRADLLDRILGVSGHVVARPWNGQFEDRAATVARLVLDLARWSRAPPHKGFSAWTRSDKRWLTGWR